MALQWFLHEVAASGGQALTFAVFVLMLVAAFLIGRAVGWWRYERNITQRIGPESRARIAAAIDRAEHAEERAARAESERDLLSVAVRGARAALEIHRPTTEVPEAVFGRRAR
jgi:hypothetical protein